MSTINSAGGPRQNTCAPEKGTGGDAENVPPAEGVAVATDASILRDNFDGDKALATLRARLALAGHSMRVLRYADGRTLYEVGRWGHARTFSHLHDVHAFLAVVGGSQHA